MESSCKNCKNLLLCDFLVTSPNVGCGDFISSSRKEFVLVHHYCETDFDSIVAFSDSMDVLEDVAKFQPHFGSVRHSFNIVNNSPSSDCLELTAIKDKCLLNLCENVAQYLAIGEYAMLKKSYFKAQTWFERAKDSSKFASVIIDNY